MIIQTGRRIMFYSFFAWIFIEIILFAWTSYDSLANLQGFLFLSMYSAPVLGAIFAVGLIMWIIGRINAKKIAMEVEKNLA